MKPKTDQTPLQFWEERYANTKTQTSGRPSSVLERFAKELKPGRALELGCAKGDDAIWLTRQGWSVTAVDISQNALDLALENAAQHGLSKRITFEQHDLTQSCPEGPFDLVSAMFLQTPFEFPRSEVIERAGSRLAGGGLLLLVTHGSAAPWSWSNHDHVFPTAKEEREALKLPSTEWRDEFVGGVTRTATGPSGEQADVIDNVIAISRR